MELICRGCNIAYNVDEATFWAFAGTIISPGKAIGTVMCTSCVKVIWQEKGRVWKSEYSTFGTSPNQMRMRI